MTGLDDKHQFISVAGAAVLSQFAAVPPSPILGMTIQWTFFRSGAAIDHGQGPRSIDVIWPAGGNVSHTFDIGSLPIHGIDELGFDILISPRYERVSGFYFYWGYGNPAVVTTELWARLVMCGFLAYNLVVYIVFHRSDGDAFTYTVLILVGFLGSLSYTGLPPFSHETKFYDGVRFGLFTSALRFFLFSQLELMHSNLPMLKPAPLLMLALFFLNYGLIDGAAVVLSDRTDDPALSVLIAIGMSCFGGSFGGLVLWYAVGIGRNAIPQARARLALIAVLACASAGDSIVTAWLGNPLDPAWRNVGRALHLGLAAAALFFMGSHSPPEYKAGGDDTRLPPEILAIKAAGQSDFTQRPFPVDRPPGVGVA
jgi:hypothetical protein